MPHLGNRALNLAGLLYVPIIFLDARFGSQTLLKTMLHLLLFTTLFKLAAIRRERDLSLALALSGLLFVASVSTSFHWAILLYVLARGLRRLERAREVGPLARPRPAAPDEWSRDRAARSLPGRGPLVELGRVATVLLAVPLFLFLPRLKAPYVKGAEAGREITTGFSENVDPDLFGALKQSDRVFLRITSEEALGEGGGGRPEAPDRSRSRAGRTGCGRSLWSAPAPARAPRSRRSSPSGRRAAAPAEAPR